MFIDDYLIIFSYYKWDPADKVRYVKNMMNLQHVESRTKVQMGIRAYQYLTERTLSNCPVCQTDLWTFYTAAQKINMLHLLFF